MKKQILVILAAGIGSRFGGGIKQLEPVDNQGHLIIDYSIHDAVQAGFNKIVFIIRHDIEADFRERIGNRIEQIAEPLGVEVVYAFQETSMLPTLAEDVMQKCTGRMKPWGTGHAVLCAADCIDAPFAVINADDYYGKKGFKLAADFLGNGQYGLVGYILKNTLSENGGVTRGVCSVEDGKLVSITETRNIVKAGEYAEADGKRLDEESLVSMNFWCYPLNFLEVLSEGFRDFLCGLNNPEKDEYLLPVIADGMLKVGVEYTVLPTNDKWFGVTYQEDKPAVVEKFKELKQAGVYEEELFGDL